MAKILIIGLLLASYPGQASDWSSGCPNYRKIQLAGLVILGGLTLNAWASPNTANSTQVLCTDEFIIASTWLGNAYGIVDTVAWTLDFISGYIFYAKGDTKEVEALKENIREIKKQHHKNHQEKIYIVTDICDKIIAYVNNKECVGDVNHNCSKDKEHIIDCINVAREIFHAEIKNREETAIIL